MKSLLRVTKALKDAAAELPPSAAIDDLAYLVDVNPSGADSLVVYVIFKNREPITTTKRKIEARLRTALRAALDIDVYFRWRTAVEQRAVLTMAGLIDRPVSALH